jgi:4-hydroxybenzoate polyprenyltransferase
MDIPHIEISEAEVGGRHLPAWRRRLRNYVKLVRLDRPIGIFLLLWPALWALWIAGNGNPPWSIVVIFITGVVLMRSAGCAINDYADRFVDGHVARTRGRPLPAGVVSPQEAVTVFLVLSLVSFGLVLLLDWKTVALSVVALALAVIYPFMKRYTHLPQLFLGAAFGWAVPMAFTAVEGRVPTAGWLLFVAAILWALIYDTQYAMVDREDDLEIGVKSTAILFGRFDLLIVGFLELTLLALMVYIGQLTGRGTWFYAGLALAGVLAVYHLYLIRNREPAACFKAFLHNNYSGMAIFVGLVLDYAPWS